MSTPQKHAPLVPVLPAMKWAQNRSSVFLAFNVFDMRYHKLQMASDGTLWFLGVKEPLQISELSQKLWGKVDSSKSGQTMASGWLQLYLRKKDIGTWWPRIFTEKVTIKVDWDRWQDQEQVEAEANGQADFDPNDPEQMDKMIEMMKKNGDWDENQEIPPEDELPGEEEKGPEENQDDDLRP